MSLFSCSSITNSTVPGIEKILSTVSHFQQVKHFHDVSSCLICLLNPTPIDHSPLEVFPIYKLVTTFPKFPVVLSAQWKDYLPGRQTLHSCNSLKLQLDFHIHVFHIHIFKQQSIKNIWEEKACFLLKINTPFALVIISKQTQH